jgi:maltose O-acetyltransferase
MSEGRVNRMLVMFRDDPLQAATRAIALARARLVFRGCTLATGVSATGWVRAAGAGKVRLDAGVTFVGGMVASEVVCHRGASLRVGEGCFINYGVSIEAFEDVRIGRRCLLASFVRISDRAGGRGGPVIIEDDVWLAHAVIIEPGVTVGAGSVVSAGSVVTTDVPRGSLASGNPAQCVRLTAATPKSFSAPKELNTWLSNSAS